MVIHLVEKSWTSNRNFIGSTSGKDRSNFPEIPESVSDLIRKVIDSTPGEERSNFVST